MTCRHRKFVKARRQAIGEELSFATLSLTRRHQILSQGASKFAHSKDSRFQRVLQSFSISNRTELIKEKDVQANFGITFNLDTLFSKP